jgi:hypothetical protein
MDILELITELKEMCEVMAEEECKPAPAALLAALALMDMQAELRGRQLKAIFDKLPGPNPYPFPEE